MRFATQVSPPAAVTQLLMQTLQRCWTLSCHPAQHMTRYGYEVQMPSSQTVPAARGVSAPVAVKQLQMQAPQTCWTARCRPGRQPGADRGCPAAAPSAALLLLRESSYEALCLQAEPAPGEQVQRSPAQDYSMAHSRWQRLDHVSVQQLALCRLSPEAWGTLGGQVKGIT